MRRIKITAMIPQDLIKSLGDYGNRLGVGRNALLTLAVDLFLVTCPAAGNGKRSQMVASLRKNIQTILDNAEKTA